MKDSENKNHGIITKDEYLSGGVIDFTPTSETDRETALYHICVKAAENKSHSVRVVVRVMDKAGNISDENSMCMAINPDPINVQISIDGVKHKEADEGYYNTARTVTIKTDDTKYTFNKDAFWDAIKIKKIINNSEEDVKSVILPKDNMEIKEDTDGYTVQFTFKDDATYEWSFEGYTNLANTTVIDENIKAVSENPKEKDAIYKFTVDTQAPTGKLSVSRIVNGKGPEVIYDSSIPYKIADLIKIGLIANGNVLVGISQYSEDIKTLYYRQPYEENTEALSEKQLEQLYKDKKFQTEASHNVNDNFVIYARITDKAGNTTYIGTEGIIVDLLRGTISLAIAGNESENGYYKDDVTIKATVNENNEMGFFSGIKRVTYKIEYCESEEDYQKGNWKTKEGESSIIELVNYEKNSLRTDLKSSFTESITVDAKEYNYDYVRVKFFAKDNAGNDFLLQKGDKLSADTMVELKINSTQPKVIVNFDSNNKGKTEKYFRLGNEEDRKEPTKHATRVAKITITDRASTFDAHRATEAIKQQITAKDSHKTDIMLDKTAMIGNWVSAGDTHTVAVYFFEDGNYDCTWDALGYTNKANYKQAETEVIGDTPIEFIVDNTYPEGFLKMNGTKEDVGEWKDWIRKKLENFQFFFENKRIILIGGGNDAISPYDLYYYEDKQPKHLTKDQLDEKWTESKFIEKGERIDVDGEKGYFTGFELPVEPGFEGIYYLRVEDYAGNYVYVSSDGYVVENTPPTIKLTPSVPDTVADKNSEPQPIDDAPDDQPDTYGYYNGDNNEVYVKVKVKEDETSPYSGIKKVSYTITKEIKETEEIVETQSGTLFEDSNNPGKDPINNFSKRVASLESHTVEDDLTIKVEDLTQRNNGLITVTVTVEDNAGNMATKAVKLDINTTSPTIEVIYPNEITQVTGITEEDKEKLKKYSNNNKYHEIDGGRGYFSVPRVAIVKITQKGDFDEIKAKEAIKITAKDANNNDVKLDKSKMIQGWKFSTEKSHTDPDRYTKYTLIEYIEDARYTLDIVGYTDNSQNAPQSITYSPANQEHITQKFAIDTKKPVGSLSATGVEFGNTNNSWENQLIDSLTFGRWSMNGITVNGTFSDETSPFEVAYYKVANDKALTLNELEREIGDKTSANTRLQQIPLWQLLDTTQGDSPSKRQGTVGTIGPDEQFTIYMKLTDKAGNTSYISTDGMIVDATAPVVINLIPEGESHAGMEGDLYSGDVNVSVIVEDTVTQGDTYSGIASIEYTISSLGTVTDSDTINFAKDNPTKGDLQQKYEGSILVDSEQNNSNEILVEVVVTDNAGNQTKEQLELQIDVTPPEIMISYDNNAPDSDSYYKETRVATISVSERNFDPELVLVDITNTDGPIPVLSNWTESGGGGNGDDTVHSATISYEEDGDYTFEVECTDMADNQAEEITFEPGTVNEKEFTIDQTLPEISVSYDNNDVYNEKYFKEGRVATVTIREHNFVRDRVEFTQTANRGASIPGVSWSSNGDTHTATIPYNSDGDYTFEVTMQDMAGNESEEADYGGSAAGKDFIVDTEISELEITGVENGKAYKDEVVPAVRFSDANFGDYEIKLTRTRRDEINQDVTEQFIQGMTITGSGGYGTFDTFAEIPENDGIYTLYAKMVDLAGNKLEETVTFIVNRFGSLYVYSDYLISLIQNGGAYVQEVEEDLVITEYNADRLVAGSLQIEITRDGRPLEEVVYTPSVVYESESGNDEFVAPNGWSQYRYEIAKENFAADGVYKMEVSSKDASGNNPENTNYEDKGILFRVDSTAPELTSVVGLEETIVNANKLDVSYEIYDTIGLKSMKVYVDGKLYGEEITQFEDLSNYAGMFTLNESRAEQSVRLVIEDLAGNITDTDAADFTSVYAFQKKVIISTSALIRLLANRNMMIGIGATAAAVVIGFWFILFWKRKKKKEENK